MSNSERSYVDTVVEDATLGYSGGVYSDAKWLSDMKQEILLHKRKQATSVLAVGRLLQRVQGQLRGKFVGWVERECGFSHRTAYNYISAYEAFGKEDGASLFISPSAMYVLAVARDDMDGNVREQVRELVSNGVFVTLKMAKELVKSAAVVDSPQEATLSLEAPRVESRDSDRAELVEDGAIAVVDGDSSLQGPSGDSVDPESHGEMIDEEEREREEVERKVQATKRLVTDLIAKSVRAVDDYHALNPNRMLRAAIVKSLQSAMEKLW